MAARSPEPAAAPPSIASRHRRTQRERSEETTGRILDATIDLLHDRGFYRMSTTEIADRAGVSRGALSHHFGSKEEIVVAAVARQLREATAGLHAMAADIRRLGGTSDDILAYIWRMMSDRLFFVTMEYLPEARHNPDFRDKIVGIVREFHSGLNAVWTELAEQTGTDGDRTVTLMNATMCLIRGMIAQSTVRDDHAYYGVLLDYWKEQLRREFGAVSEPALAPARAVRVASRRVAS